jgi:signal transduction histidine kinase/CheY-like chemotaxis protein
MSLTSRFTLQFGLAATLGVSLALAASLGLFGVRLGDMGETLGDDLERSVAAQHRKGAEGLLDRFAEAVKPALLDYDRAEMAALARAALDVSGAAALRVYDAHGRGVADAREDGEPFSAEAPPPLKTARPGERLARWVEGDTLYTGRPICLGDSCIGAVAVGVDRSDIRRERAAFDAEMAAAQSRFFREAAALGGLALMIAAAVAALFGWLLGRRLTRSLREAIEGLDRIAAGSTDVHIETKDAQLAELGAAVERVAAAIAEGPRSGPTAAIVADMADGLFVARLGGEIEVANPALHALLGAPEPALVGADAFETLGLPRAASLDDFAHSVAALSSVTRRDGATAPVMMSAKVSAGAEPSEGRVIGVARDATELAAAETRLAAAQAKADAADRAKAEFLAVMSHELRTPLNGVLGGAAVLAGSELSPQQRGFVDMVQTSGKSLLTMVTNILDLARLESGAAAVDNGPVDIEAVAQEILAAVTAPAAAKGLELFLRVQPGAPVLTTDREKLIEIGANLAENAVKFTDSGSVGIDLGFEVIDGVAELRLSVQDTGPGIDPDKVHGIFDAFSQGDSSASRSHGGAGLGLALTRRLVDMLGGEITVASTPGKGSTFTVKLKAETEGPAAPPPRVLPNLRTLVVAPDAREREALAEQLAFGGAKVETVASAAAAHAMLRDSLERRQPIGLVVHPEDLPAFAASGLSEWLRAEGPAHVTASVALRPEGAAMAQAGPLPDRVRTATRPAPTDALLAAARDAVAAARAAEDDAADGGPAEAATDPAFWPDEKPTAAAEAAERHVVLAEHNEVNRIVLGSFLRKSGYVPHLATNGFEAVKQFKDVRPTLMIMDASMPTMNGLEAAKAIRRHELETNQRPVVIIGLTDGGREGERERCAAAGMNDSVAKPVKLDELEAKIERWTSLFGQTGAARSAAG